VVVVLVGTERVVGDFGRRKVVARVEKDSTPQLP
jgi:hypothetical protein